MQNYGFLVELQNGDGKPEASMAYDLNIKTFEEGQDMFDKLEAVLKGQADIITSKEKGFIKEVVGGLMDLVEGLDESVYSGSQKIYMGDKVFKLLDNELEDEERKELGL